MDAYEATRVVFSRIQSLDPENASKIMGLLLIQDHGEKEMIRLAFGPETLVQSVVMKARKELGLPSNTPSTPSTPSSPSPFLSRQNSSSSSRLINSSGINLTIQNPSWAPFSDAQNQNPDELISPQSSLPIGSSSSSIKPSSLPFYPTGSTDVMDDFQLQDQLSFLNDSSALGPKNPDLFYTQQDVASSPTGDHLLFPSYSGNWGGSLHRRSYSVSDACLGSDDTASGFGWKPCLYFARGYCKNGTSCRFLHGESDGGVTVGSPNKLDLMDQCQELLRSKSSQQHRLVAASQLMASNSFPYSPKGMNFLLQQQQNDTQRAAAAALMMSDDLHKFGRSRLERNDMINPASRQIYLTFPADSTFREEDVSNYFSIYGPVEDVRIPYQQKRMFGFVTFVYPETVKIILAKGNPHFVCDARVLVKPYKEKGKASDKKHQQVERGEFSVSPCGTPTGMESRDPFDLQLGSRMFYNTQDMLWRRKLEEQADLQQALELQSRRLMNLQLLDVKKQHHLRALSTSSPFASPTQLPSLFSPNIVVPSFNSGPEASEENGSSLGPNIGVCNDLKLQQTVNGGGGKDQTDKNGIDKESPQKNEGSDLHENLEHNLPDSLFASPTKASSEFLSVFSNANGDAANEAPSSVNGNSATFPTSSPQEIASFKSFNCQVPPRFSSGHGAIGMSTGSGGPTCPVGI